MKRLSFILASGLSFLILATNGLLAQTDENSKPFIVQTNYIRFTDETRDINLDSILMIWKELVMDPNPYFTDSKILTHWWGHDSRQLIIIHELKSWDDIKESFDKRSEILKELRKSNDENTKKFMDVIGDIFEGSHHSDEIYRVVVEK